MNTKILSNMFWRFLERFGAKGVEFIVSIVLARLLSPDAYGTIALVMVFTTLLNVFVDSGFGNALIQKRNADDLDFSSVFYFNITICIILYGCMFGVSPVIAEFYNQPELVPVIRVLSLTLVISGVKNIQQAYVSRNLQFKKFFFATLGGTVVAAVAGIMAAYSGFGVWALVIQQLVNALIDTIILWMSVQWRPKLIFSFTRLKELLFYGWKLLASALLDTLFTNIRQLVIGKVYSTGDLAYYNQGEKYPQLLATNINASIDSVLLPAMSKVQDNPERVKAMTRRSITISIYIMAPIMCGMFAIADSLVPLVLTDKWIASIPFFRVFCLTCIFYPIHTANLNAIKAIGRSDIFLKLEIIKKIDAAIVLLLTVWFGPFVMAASGLINTWIAQLINAWPNKKLLNYSYKEQLFDIMPMLIISGLMTVGVMFIGYYIETSVAIKIIIQVISGMIIYWGFSIIFKIDSYLYLKNIIISMLKNKSAV